MSTLFVALPFGGQEIGILAKPIYERYGKPGLVALSSFLFLVFLAYVWFLKLTQEQTSKRERPVLVATIYLLFAVEAGWMGVVIQNFLVPLSLPLFVVFAVWSGVTCAYFVSVSSFTRAEMRRLTGGAIMKLDEAISIITYQIYLPDRVEESCQLLVEEIRKIAGTIPVEKGEFTSASDYGIVYNRERKAIRVDPIVLSYNLRDLRKDTSIPYDELLWYLVDHELGHYELQQHSLTPTLHEDKTYMTLYGRFEDYAISRFLRSGRYIAIEEAILKTESRLGVHTLSDICVSALCVALGYVNLEEPQLQPKTLRYMQLASSKMNEVKELMDLPELVSQLRLELAREYKRANRKKN